MNKKEIGHWGEKIATTYLKKQGYQIMENNWHHQHRELDIIAYYKNVIGVEVKTRKSFGPPQSILKPAQISRLRQTLLKYCQIKGLNYEKSQLELIVITKLNKQSLNLKHYRQI